jgi:apolipoprotein D and lipocalin family protein
MSRRCVFAWLVSLVWLAALACAPLGCGTEPPLDVAQNVDLSLFQGKWYEIAKLPRVTQTDCFGTMAFYTQTAAGALQLVNQCNVGSSDGPLDTVTMNATVPDPSVSAKLALEVGGYSGDYWILEVGSSYEYAVVGHPTRAYLWILSRAPTLDPVTLQGILDRAQNNHFDTSQLEYTPQLASGQRVSSDVPLGQVPPAMTTGCAVARPGGGNTAVGCFGLAMAVAALRLRRRSSGRALRLA